MFYLPHEDGLAFETINDEQTKTSPWLFICDHASNRVPSNFDLKIDPALMNTHIAYDPGAAEVTRLVAQKMNAPAIFHRFTRLVLDPNRRIDDPEMFPEIACDGTPLPTNTGISEEEKLARVRHLYSPYQCKIADLIAQMRTHDIMPRIVNIHSFTPELKGQKRPWEVGILWKWDGRLAIPFMENLRKDKELTVGDNEPYSLHLVTASSIEGRALELGLPPVVIELRQDTVQTPEDQESWAERIINALPKELPEH